LSEEEPDVLDTTGDVDGETEPRSEQADEPGERPATDDPTDDAGIDDEVLREASQRGQLADEAGGSVAAVTRIADEPY
jgi:hypothetical protein